MRLSSLFNSAAEGDPTGSGWRRPLVIMVAIQVATVIVVAIALSGASPVVTTAVIVGWAVTLVIITALATLLQAASQVVTEAQRLRETHLALVGTGSAPVGVAEPAAPRFTTGDVPAHDAPWDGSATIQFPLGGAVELPVTGDRDHTASSADDDADGTAARHSFAPAPAATGDAVPAFPAPPSYAPVRVPEAERAPEVEVSHGSGQAPDLAVEPVPADAPAALPAAEADPSEPTDGPAPDHLLLPEAHGSTAVKRRGKFGRVAEPAPFAAPAPEPEPEAEPEPERESEEPDPATSALAARIAERRSSAARATLAALAAFPTENSAPVRRSIHDRVGSRSVGSLR